MSLIADPQGCQAGEQPVEQPTKLQFVINIKTAKELGPTIAQSILVGVDEVIV
jgi:putative ABC transport system substrate-binding protein